MGIKRNKESVIYFIVSILLLETVRVKHNKIEKKHEGAKDARDAVASEQKTLLIKAALVYAVFLFWLIFDYFISLSGKITSVYPQTQSLKSNVALFLNGLVSYVLTFLILRFLLELYVKKMNEAFGFWKKLGRSAIDGTVAIVQTPIKAGGVVKDKMVEGVKTGTEKLKDTAHISAYAAQRLPENVKQAATSKENWKYDELIAKVSQLGIPALVLVVAVQLTDLAGAAAIVAGLTSLGGPLGIIGGLTALGILVIISRGIGRYGFKAVFEGVLTNLYKKGHSKEEILSKIQGYKITKKMKESLTKYIEELDSRNRE